MTLKRIVRNLDYTLLAAVGLILIIGLLILRSATINGQNPAYENAVLKQVISIIIGSFLLYLMIRFDYQVLQQYARHIYYLNLGMLFVVLLIGKESNGATSWISLGPFSLQPAEFSKVFLIITLANFLVQREGKLNTWKDLLPVFIHVGLPILLILKQPDLGTSLVFIAIMFGMMFVAGARPSYLLFIIISVLGLTALAIYAHMAFGVKLPLKDYQLMRLIIFINPWMDYKGYGWNVIQSQVAVGSGGFFGKGLNDGTQNQLNFLPYQHTDFIFSVIGEELGFIGATMVLALFFLVVYQGIMIAMKARDSFGSFLAVGIISMYTFHILENVGMVLGMMPVTGIPLPFVSYGGSSMMTNLAALGILLNIKLRRQKIMF